MSEVTGVHRVTQAVASVLIAAVVATPVAMVVMVVGGGLGGLVIGVYLGMAVGSVALGWSAVKLGLGPPYAVSAAAVMLFTGLSGSFWSLDISGEPLGLLGAVVLAAVGLAILTEPAATPRRPLAWAGRITAGLGALVLALLCGTAPVFAEDRRTVAEARAAIVFRPLLPTLAGTSYHSVHTGPGGASYFVGRGPDELALVGVGVAASLTTEPAAEAKCLAAARYAKPTGCAVVSPGVWEVRGTGPYDTRYVVFSADGTYAAIDGRLPDGMSGDVLRELAVSMRPGEPDDLALIGGRLPAGVLRVLL